ncbi:MAG: hypothetical protein AUJ96_29350 [Armatimonadetes bacterium CG2_30_66_41]|nr:DUF2088 domain-containing protein [Armatimonadota bacterium]OIO93999.1 MAG: hypothetical protein AUJ96_29350 [Armatimonadetes bacterium CG2_30_66_41]NCO91492.1 DUF2088 domain-containing protein [Armatimonadota bacterium]NCP30134.1 DUF2088 domain-containing protein [Armatimonadota bacterium]NCQ32400.1 DUF2088 domain-containing protein [Armatimonadota bacterium]
MNQPYPKFLRVRQLFDAPVCTDLAGAVRDRLAELDLAGRVRSGQSVAITAGSRGIKNIDRILGHVVEALRGLGLEPFLFPCMGSHGGATAEGQEEVLRDYGITEAAVGAPIRATMEAVEVGRLQDYDTPVMLNTYAAEADHVVVVNRVKPHPCYGGPVQSGLMKMMMIGLGNHRGASLYHRAIITHGFTPLVYATAREVLRTCPILCGLAVLENAYDQTADLVAVRPEELIEQEERLLLRAAGLMPRLPFDEIDLLVIDEVGKNISGSGMDSNLVGRGKPIEGRITRIYIRDLTPESHGNASGVGWADFCHQRVVDRTDVAGTYLNALTSGYPDSVATPLHLATDRECLDAALATIGLPDPPAAKVVWIKNTKQVSEVAVSEAFAEAVEARPDLEPTGDLGSLAFDAAGDVRSPLARS